MSEPRGPLPGTEDSYRDDPIAPALIEHRRDEYGGPFDQANYNYLTYWFVEGDALVTARAYFDDPWRVSVYAPQALAPPLREVEAPALFDRVLLFLARRFKVIDMLGPEGYRPIWMERRPPWWRTVEPPPPWWRAPEPPGDIPELPPHPPVEPPPRV